VIGQHTKGCCNGKSVTFAKMDLDEILGPPLKKQQKGKKGRTAEPGVAHLRALLLVVDCSELPQENINVSKEGIIAAKNVIFVCSQQRDPRDGAWRKCLLDASDDPVTNLSSKYGTKGFMQKVVSTMGWGGKSVSADMYFHSGNQTVPKSGQIEGIRTMVRRVAQSSGPACVVGAAVSGPGETSPKLLEDLRVALVKGAVKMYV
jgi:hypothetical protein